jgi:phosphatidylglycerol:prolipoprotein diacylglycerol transferase
MHPIVFEIPGLGLPIRSFGLMVAGGFLLGMWIMNLLVRRHAADPDAELAKYSTVQVWILVGVILGARLMYVIVEIARGSPNGQEYLSDPLSILFVWKGGLVMFGGLFGGILLGSYKARAEGLPLPQGLDLGLTAGFFGLAVGRIGCFLVGDDYGKVVPAEHAHLPFPITLRVPAELPEGSLFGAENAGQTLWATQIWMALNALLLGLLGLVLLRLRWPPGRVATVLVLLYSIGRFAIEAFRGDDLRGLWFGGALSTSQVVAIAVFLVTVCLLWLRRGQAARAS